MSEISVLSNHYSRLVSTTDKLNNSIIVLKKRLIFKDKSKDQPIALKLTEEELTLAQEYLIDFLNYLLAIPSTDVKDSDYIPNLVLFEFQSRLENSSPFLKDDLKEIIRLISTGKDITEEQFAILDKMVSLLDSERTVLFRKLRTARG